MALEALEPALEALEQGVGRVSPSIRKPGARLPRHFYGRPAETVAIELLGCTLYRRVENGATGGPASILAGRIVETEAYVGEADRACHAHSGPTPRNAVMYGPPGYAYVYFVYGMHDMMNVVCQPEGRPEAVLLRAIEPVDGIDAMRERRPGVRRDRDLGNGPGKLCRALGITRALNGADLRRGELWIVPGGPRPGERLARAPRIGVEYAGADARRLLRFYLAGNPHVSQLGRTRARRVPRPAVSQARR